MKKSFSEFAMSGSSVTVFPLKVIYLMLFVVLCLFVNVLSSLPPVCHKVFQHLLFDCNIVF